MREIFLFPRRFFLFAFLGGMLLGGCFFIGTGSVSAATVDTASLLGTDFDTYDMKMKVRAVTEDKDAYYVEYGYDTFEVEGDAWKPVSKVSSMKVRKESLGEEDLGLYAAKQLDEVAGSQREYLKSVQKEEKKTEDAKPGDSSDYKGIIGQSLNPEDQTFEGYEPVKPPVKEEETVIPEVSNAQGGIEETGSESGSESVSIAPSLPAAEAVPDTSALDALASKVASLEEKLRVLTELVDTLTEFYTNFNLASFLKNDGA